MRDQKKKKDNSKKRQSQLEAFIFSILEKSMKDALKQATDDFFKGLR